MASASPTFRPRSRVRIRGRNLRIDVVTAEVVSTLRKAGLEPILLKGPTLGRWLYGDDLRAYSDTDLLVPPSQIDRATRVLADLGFTDAGFVETAHDRPWYAVVWSRGRDEASIDLHRMLVGVGLAPQRAWDVLASNTETMRLEGADIRVLSEPARALHVALHAADHAIHEKPLEDLALAVGLPYETWERASALAADLDALSALGAGLRLTPHGGELASRLGLPPNRSVEVALRAGDAPRFALALEWFAGVPGFRAKLLFALRKAIPPRQFIRGWTPLARRGAWGLTLAYLWRPLYVAGHAICSLPAWWQARKEVGSRRNRR